MLKMYFVLQIDGYCQSKGLVIAGYYHANENFQDSTYGFD